MSIPGIEEVRAHILGFRSLGQYSTGHDYIVGLSQELRQHKRIAIEIAQLYLAQGNYIRAWDACSLSSPRIFQNDTALAPFTLEICDLNSVTLALLAAYIGISRHGKLRTALQIADRVYEAWLATNPRESAAGFLNYVPAGARDRFFATIEDQRLALQGSFEKSSSDEVQITESRILMEFYYYKIRVVAAEQGLLEESVTKKATADRLDVLRKWAIHHERLREARYLTYFRLELTGNNSEDLRALHDLIHVLGGTKYTVEEAQTHLDLARCMLRSRNEKLMEEAQQHIAKAEELFKVAGHVFGQLDLMDMQMSEGQTLDLQDLLRGKLDCANAYLAKDCYQQGIKCLIFAIPVNHDMDEIFQQTQSIIERAEAEISRVGGVFLEQTLFINAVAQAIVRAPEYGYARKSLEDYLGRLPNEISPKILGLLYLSLRGAYTNVGDFKKALVYAEQALIASLQGASYVDISDAAFALAVTKLDRGRLFLPKSEIAKFWLADSIRFLSAWVPIDQFMSCHQQQLEKYAWLAMAENQMAQFFSDENASKRSDDWLDTALECERKHGVPSDQVREMQIARATRTLDHDLAVELTCDRLRSRQAEKPQRPFHLAQAAVSASLMTYQRFCSGAQVVQTESNADAAKVFKDLVDATKLAGLAFDQSKAAGGSEMVITALNLLYTLLQHFSTDNGQELSRYFLVEAQKIEVFCDAMRRSSASTGDMSSLFEKRGLVSGPAHRDLYSNAVEACVVLEEIGSAWEWVQKSKARALSDHFGVRAMMPPALLLKVAADKDAQLLYEQERRNTKLALEEGPLKYLEARRQAESVRSQMRSHALLSQILDIREGAFNVHFDASELTDAMKMCDLPSHSIKYVDWFITSPKRGGNRMLLLVRQSDGTTRSQQLNTTLSTVELWVKRTFRFPEEAEPPLRGDEARSKLRELGPLIQGLEQMTDEGDLLILSPSGILNSIPIHALPLGKRTLIERNPVIYSSSAAVFRQCHMRATAQASKDNNDMHSSVFLAVYEGSSTEEELEQTEIYQHGDKLAHGRFPFDVHKGPAATKAAFKQLVQQSPFVHFHGHAIFDKTDVLQSCLVLGELPCPPMSPYEPERSTDVNVNDPRKLTVADIFSIDMRDNAAHFTVIACDSSTQDVAPGDEPLGLISAFLYAGATSVLGALWPVDSRTARIFTEIFYEDLGRQVAAQTGPEQASRSFLVLNLAAALQNVVVKMMDRKNLETKAPLHWAAYVLHGAWFRVYPKSALTMGRKEFANMSCLPGSVKLGAEFPLEHEE